MVAGRGRNKQGGRQGRARSDGTGRLGAEAEFAEEVAAVAEVVA